MIIGRYLEKEYHLVSYKPYFSFTNIWNRHYVGKVWVENFLGIIYYSFGFGSLNLRAYISIIYSKRYYFAHFVQSFVIVNMLTFYKWKICLKLIFNFKWPIYPSKNGDSLNTFGALWINRSLDVSLAIFSLRSFSPAFLWP